jgi:hypothetical protein
MTNKLVKEFRTVKDIIYYERQHRFEKLKKSPLAPPHSEMRWPARRKQKSR